MKYSNLYDLIKYIQYGTKIHIGVLFFGNYGSEKCFVPWEHTIHPRKICDELKSKNDGLTKCIRCRNAAIYKAFKNKKPFASLCINGVYEYTRPVMMYDDVACIIYIGNISDGAKGYHMLKARLGDKKHLLSTLEEDFPLEKCEAVGALIESYIRVLLKDSPKSQSADFSPLIENIKNYAMANIGSDINISDIARVFKYNEQYLGKLFKRETQMNFSDYLNEIRIERAKHLLLSTNETVLCIALSVGFNSVTYFNRVFKKYMKTTPSEFRMGKRSGADETVQ